MAGAWMTAFLIDRLNLLRETGADLFRRGNLPRSQGTGGIPTGYALRLFEAHDSRVTGSMVGNKAGLVGREDACVSAPATGIGACRRQPQDSAPACVCGDLG